MSTLATLLEQAGNALREERLRRWRSRLMFRVEWMRVWSFLLPRVAGTAMESFSTKGGSDEEARIRRVPFSRARCRSVTVAAAQKGNGNGGKHLSGELDGFQEVPSISSNAEGKIKVKLNGSSIRYKLEYSGFTPQNKAMVAHIHFAQEGVNGGIAAFLCGGNGSPPCPETSGLDVPCDLKPEEQVIVILNLHGAGSIGNWQRHYFPALDFKEKYRLVIATPTAAGSGTIGASGAPAVRMWGPATDDAYLQNVTNLVLDRVGRANVKAFWLAGHSQGGMTSNRVVCSDFFKDKVDGWLSLSGGRIGPAPDLAGFLRPERPAGRTAGRRRRASARCRRPAGVRHLIHLHVRAARDHGIAGDLAVGGRGTRVVRARGVPTSWTRKLAT